VYVAFDAPDTAKHGEVPVADHDERRGDQPHGHKQRVRAVGRPVPDALVRLPVEHVAAPAQEVGQLGPHSEHPASYAHQQGRRTVT